MLWTALYYIELIIQNAYCELYIQLFVSTFWKEVSCLVRIISVRIVLQVKESDLGKIFFITYILGIFYRLKRKKRKMRKKVNLRLKLSHKNLHSERRLVNGTKICHFLWLRHIFFKSGFKITYKAFK